MELSKQPLFRLGLVGAAIIIVSLVILGLGPAELKRKIEDGQAPIGGGEVRIAPPTQAPVSSERQQGPYPCPSTAEFCDRGRDVLQNGTYIGFGANIPLGSPITASFGGKVQVVRTSLPMDEEIITVYVDNIDRGLRGVYMFRGTLLLEGETVVDGGDIGVTGEAMSPFDNTTLLFQLIKDDFISGKPVKLTSSDFLNN